MPAGWSPDSTSTSSPPLPLDSKSLRGHNGAHASGQVYETLVASGISPTSREAATRPQPPPPPPPPPPPTRVPAVVRSRRRRAESCAYCEQQRRVPRRQSSGLPTKPTSGSGTSILGCHAELGPLLGQGDRQAATMARLGQQAASLA